MLSVLAASSPMQKEPVIFTRNVVSGLAPNNTDAPYRITEPTAPPKATIRYGFWIICSILEHSFSHSVRCCLWY